MVLIWKNKCSELSEERTAKRSTKMEPLQQLHQERRWWDCVCKDPWFGVRPVNQAEASVAVVTQDRIPRFYHPIIPILALLV